MDSEIVTCKEATYTLDQKLESRYTHGMRKRVSMIFVLVLIILLASCSPGHSGGNEIAFIRNGHIWTIDPNGANAFQVVSQNMPVIGYIWSPNHQILAFRTLDTQIVKPPIIKDIVVNPITGQISDAPSTINTVGIDGGTPIPIMLSSTGIQYNNPYWNVSGTRLIYRQESTELPFIPGNAIWWISQNDQPDGIAVKHFPSSYSYPSFSYIDSMAIGSNMSGIFTSSLQGTDIHSLISGQLPGHPLSATLERVLWQPAHAQPLILFATTSDKPTKLATHSDVQLVVLSPNGQQTTLTTCSCIQFAWSPDGSFVLYSTGTSYTILNVATHQAFSIPTEQNSVPYWSPDSKFLLFDGVHQLQLVTIATENVHILLSDGLSSSSPVEIAGVHSLVQPVPNNIWASDSLHFLFLTHSRLHWQNTMLSQGLYSVAIDAKGRVQNSPTLVDAGNDTQAGWSFEDQNTSFLY